MAEEVAATDTWRLAEAYVATHPGCDIFVGKGDSMLPLYRDRTVLLVRQMRMAELRSGMTVIFIGDRGRPVAHTLVKKTARGWVAQGMGNASRDRTLVHSQNYRGTVVKAYAPQERIAAANVALDDVPRTFFATPAAD